MAAVEFVGGCAHALGKEPPIYTPINARLQAEAMKLGKINFLTPEEAVKAAVGTDAAAGRPWELWKARIGKIE